VSVRVIAATNRDLSELVTQQKFREDLYYRLCVVPVRVPALRERREDVRPLAEYFLGEFCARNNSSRKVSRMGRLKRSRITGGRATFGNCGTR